MVQKKDPIYNGFPKCLVYFMEYPVYKWMIQGVPPFQETAISRKVGKKTRGGDGTGLQNLTILVYLSGCKDEDEDEDEDDDNDESLVKGFLLMSVPSFKLNTETQSLRTCRINSLKSEAGTEPENGPMSQTVNE